MPLGDVATYGWRDADVGGRRVLRGGGFTSTDDVATWADAGGGRVLRGGRVYCRWRRGLLSLARGLMQAAGAGREVGLRCCGQL